MKSNYKRIGNYIQLVDERNRGLKVKTLLGLSISKQFIKSVANTIGTDMENYKIIHKNQFACSTMQVRRDKKMPVALYLEDEPSIISQAYPIFEIKDTNELLPEYLMMWFTRSEFDREACFHAVGGVRGSLEWEDFLNMSLPIPSLEKQKEIINEYHIIHNRILLNNQLIAKLEETAQTIYKQWFVDFEFPDESGKPYKSNGGKMVWCEELENEIPEGWQPNKLENYIEDSIGGDWGKEFSEGTYDSKVICIRGTDIASFKKGNFQNAPIRYIIKKNLESKKIYKNQIIIEISGGSPTQSTGRACIVTDLHLENLDSPLISSNFCRVLKIKEESLSLYFFGYLEYLYSIDYLFSFENSTTGVKNFDLSAFLTEEYLLKPDLELIKKYNNIHTSILNKTILLEQENQKLEELKELLLGRMVRVELETSKVEN